MIPFLRGFFLVGAILSALQATVLFELFERHMIAPLLGMYERQGVPIPAIMRSRGFRRVWPVFMALVFGTLWWFTGTPAGMRFLQAQDTARIAP